MQIKGILFSTSLRVVSEGPAGTVFNWCIKLDTAGR